MGLSGDRISALGAYGREGEPMSQNRLCIKCGRDGLNGRFKKCPQCSYRLNAPMETAIRVEVPPSEALEAWYGAPLGQPTGWRLDPDPDYWNDADDC